MSSPAGAADPVGLELSSRREESYGKYVRDFQIGLLRKPLGRVLDVGCAEGAGAELLRANGASHLAGIELDEEFAAAAEERYDDVVQGSVPEDLRWEPQSFDTILCYDILEHVYDPWTTVRELVKLLKPGGQFHLSIPNARHKNVWMPLLVGGSFRYAPAGLLDVTHIRFFSRSDAVRMLEAGGLKVNRVDSTALGSRKRKLAAALTGGRAVEFFAVQWFLLAEPQA